MPRTLARSTTSALVLGLGLTVTLAGCGSSDSEPKADSSSSSSTSSSPSASAESSEGASAETSFTQSPATGPAIKGDDFAFNAPQGWNDVTARAKKLNAMVDVAYSSDKPVGNFAPNVNVVVSKGVYTGALSDTVLGQGEQQIKQELTKQGATDVKIEPRVKIAGDVALHITARLKTAQASYRTDQYLALHDGGGYTVTFSVPTSFDDAKRDAISFPSLASWTWS